MTAIMTLLTLIGIIGLIAAGIIIWGISTYNRLITFKELINEAWSGIDVQLKRRHDLIPNLIATVKGYSVHERETLENLTKQRTSAINAQGVTEQAQAEAQLMQTLKSVFAVAESYPDLKANQNFLELQKELSSIEGEMQLARRYYNGTVRNYNRLAAVFPAKIIAQAYGFEAIAYFELNNPQERETPKVEF